VPFPGLPEVPGLPVEEPVVEPLPVVEPVVEPVPVCPLPVVVPDWLPVPTVPLVLPGLPDVEPVWFPGLPALEPLPLAPPVWLDPLSSPVPGLVFDPELPFGDPEPCSGALLPQAASRPSESDVNAIETR
jgi:type VI secretion system protein